MRSDLGCTGLRTVTELTGEDFQARHNWKLGAFARSEVIRISGILLYHKRIYNLLIHSSKLAQCAEKLAFRPAYGLKTA
jgi:hypothetical protein